MYWYGVLQTRQVGRFPILRTECSVDVCRNADPRFGISGWFLRFWERSSPGHANDWPMDQIRRHETLNLSPSNLPKIYSALRTEYILQVLGMVLHAIEPSETEPIGLDARLKPGRDG